MRISKPQIPFRPRLPKAPRLPIRVQTSEPQPRRRLQHTEPAIFEELIDSAPAGIVITDKHGTIEDCNVSGAAILGFEPEQTLGRKFYDFLVDVEPGDRRAFLHQMLSNRANRVASEIRAVNQAGTTILLELVLGTSVVSGRRYFTGHFRDITGRRDMEMQLRRAQAMESIGHLAGGLAHDYNNLLTAVVGNLELVSLELPVDSPLHEFLRDAQTAAGRATDLSRQILTFSRGGSPKLETVDLEKIITDAIGISRVGSNCSFSMDFPKMVWQVQADASQLVQAFTNILINAVQATEGPGLVQVVMENVESRRPLLLPYHQLPGGRYVKITITDQGTGIAPGNLFKIFDPFFTTKDRPDKKGTGLGLSTTYSIVTRHKGGLQVGSVVGEGTTFSIYLPALASKTEVKAVVAPVEVQRTPAQILAGKRILILDDEEAILAVTRMGFERVHAHIETATNGQNALRLIREARERQEPFDLMLLDLTVPGGIGGRELVEILRAEGDQTPTIAMSGYTDQAIAGNTNFFGFIEKPFGKNDLHSLAASVFETPENG